MGRSIWTQIISYNPVPRHRMKCGLCSNVLVKSVLWTYGLKATREMIRSSVPSSGMESTDP